MSILATKAYTLFLINKTFTWIMRNREHIEVLILEAKISFIDKRLLFNRKKEEIQQHREERQEKELKKELKKEKQKTNAAEKIKVMTLLTLACGNRPESAN